MLGRTDGMAANFDGAQNLPNPTEPLNDLKQKFADLGLDDTDFVALQGIPLQPAHMETTRQQLADLLVAARARDELRMMCLVAHAGAHTIGRAQCRFFQDRLYNFSDTERSDPTLDRSYLAALRESCPAAVSDNTCLNNLDPTTPDTFDNRYYANILSNRGLLRSDQAMLSAPEEGAVSTAPIVGRFANSQAEFFQSFATAMVKMGNIAPLTGGLREVRRNCRVVN
jgi:peroxidase